MIGHSDYTCVVESIISERGGGVIFKARLENDRILNVKVPSSVRLGLSVARGQSFKLHAIERLDPDYGLQLHPATFIPVNAISIDNTKRFLMHAPEMRGIGIGKKKVCALVDELGERLRDLLNTGDAAALHTEAQGVISSHTAELMCRRWAVHSALSRSVSFLDERGITGKTARLLLSVYAERVEDLLLEDPYRLVAFFKPTKSHWDEIRTIARMLGVPPGDDRELVGGLEAALFFAHENGDTAINANEIDEKIGRFLGKRLAKAAVRVGLNQNVIVEFEGAIQHVGARAIERSVEQSILARLGPDAAPTGEQQGGLFNPLVSSAAVMQWVNKWTQDNLSLNDEQQAAVRNGLTERFSVITGGAGVGKTRTLEALGKCAMHFVRDIHFVALAGRAAKRIEDETAFEARTICSFVLAVNSKALSVSDDAVVVVDEASMVSLSDLYRLFSCIGQASVVLVGDSNQLPPVSFGEVFPILADCSAIPVVRLWQVYRQRASTGIPAASEAILKGDVPAMEHYEGIAAGLSFVSCEVDEINSVALKIFDDLRSDDCQVICLTNGGVGGTKKINREGQSAYVADVEQMYKIGLNIGSPIIHLVNDYDAGLNNGSLGTVTDIDERAGTLLAHWDDGEERVLNLAALHDTYELAYGITCHKAQGSQFSKVVIPIRTGCANLDSRMLYTAITRAETQVVLVGDKDAFIEAVGTPPTQLRRQVAFWRREQRELDTPTMGHAAA